MAALSGVANAVLDAVQPDDDYLFYVESDLIWTPETVLALIERALRVEVSSTRSAILMSGALARDRRVRMSTNDRAEQAERTLALQNTVVEAASALVDDKADTAYNKHGDLCCTGCGSVTMEHYECAWPKLKAALDALGAEKIGEGE